MRTWISSVVAAVTVLSLSHPALAYPYPPPPVAPPPFAPPPPDYAGPVYADVLSTQPIYRIVRVNQPQQQCYQQQVVYDDGRNRNNAVAGTLIGGILGGVLGDQFGHGAGRVLATVGGAAVGASVGNNVASRNDSSPQVGYQEQCQTVDAFHDEQQVDGYNVTYRYAGRVYTTRLPYDPGPRLAVNVDVAPAPY